MKVKFVIFSTIWILLFHPSNQIYVPDDGTNQKPIAYTSGIKTTSYRKPFQIHHNYSRVYHQNFDSYSPDEVDGETSQRPYPVYNAHTYGSRPPSEKLTQVYILNGTRVRKNENPARKIVLYNKEKRSPKTSLYRTCPEGATGQFAYEFSCNQFLNCWKGRGFVQNCAPGTLFNPKSLECDFPEKVYCVSGPRQTILREERSPNPKQIGCPKEFSGLIPNYTDCSKFINCVSGIENFMDCPPGTLFDVDKNICDFAHKAKCFNGQNENLIEQNIDGRLDFTAATKAKIRDSSRQTHSYNVIKCPDGLEGLHQHPTDCSKFLSCANGRTFIQDCGPGTLFNPANKICDFPYNVRCQNTSYDDGYGTERNNEETTFYETNRNNFGIGVQYGGQSGSWSSSNTSGYNQGAKQNRDYSNQGSGYYGSTNQDRTSETNIYGSGYDRSDGSRTIYYGGTPNQQPGNYHYHQNQHQQDPYGSSSNFVRPNQSGWSGQGSTYIHNTHDGYGSLSPSYDGNVHYGSGRYPMEGSNRGQTPSYTPYAGNTYGGNVGYKRPTIGGQTHDAFTPYADNTQHGYGGSTVEGSTGQTHGLGPLSTSYINRPDGYQGSITEGSNHRQTHDSYPGQVQSSWDHSYPIYNKGIVYGSNQRPFESSGQYGQVGNSWTNVATTPRTYQNNYQGTFYENNQNQGITNNDRRYDQNRDTNQRNEFNQNTLNQEAATTNYDEVVNINQVRRTTHLPYRNSYEPFLGPTLKPRVTLQSNDYDDTLGQTHTKKYTRSTTPKMEKIWPPPFPSTDVNADYVFEYDDNSEVSLEAENSPKYQNKSLNCAKSDFRCSNEKCISKSLVCNSYKDCPNGEDELKCLNYLSRFSLEENRKLAVLEKEKWDNVSIATCALMCAETKRFTCRSFNYRKVDKTCFLLNTNEGLTGGLISYYPIDYYELISEKLNCSDLYVCNNKKCVLRSKMCDGHDDCGDRMDEKGCKPEDYNYSIRLAGSKNKNEGRIEVSAFGKTGFVCDDQFGLRDADVVCRELGFPLGAAEVKGQSFFNKELVREKPFYMMDDVECLGNETRLMDCDFSGWGVHNCLEQEVVGVVCKIPEEKCATDYWQCDTSQECLPLAFVCDGLLDCSDGSDEGSQHCDAPTEIRLVNGSRQQGRLEIRHHGIWGTVCDDDFNDDAAKVVCRSLGYRGSAVVKKNGHFGTGSGPIWLDQVFCGGNETKLEECSHWNWGEHNCEHSEDVGVVCSNTHEHVYEERHQGSPPTPTRIPQEYPSRCGYRNDNIFNEDNGAHFRVVKGSLAKRGDYPWQAAIRVKGKSSSSHWCGAVIISEKFVLTAAHCLIGYSKGAYVIVAGDYNVDEEEGTEQEAYIEDFYLHANFRQGHKMNNDIALIKLKGQGFRLGGDIQAICLPDSDVIYKSDENCTISGFGSIESGKSAFSHNMRAGWVPLQKREICVMPHVYGDALTDGMFCAGSLDEGVDSCDGDSGGPLACLHDGVFTLFGITSWGQHCGHANKPGVYVKVSHYRKWIDDNFKKYSNINN